MYFPRCSVVKLTLFFDRMYTENERSTSTEVIGTYYILHSRGFKLQHLNLKFLNS